MARVLDVAAYILKAHGPMAAMKLQKLVYYSQAWSIVWDDEAIFPESILAWKNGPVGVGGHDREWGYPVWSGDILPKLKEFEKLFWREIESFSTDTGHRMHHSMAVDIICAESQGRLGELGFDHDDIYRFRLGNRRRLWGFRFLNVFEILWYDPEHNIYPTDPD